MSSQDEKESIFTKYSTQLYETKYCGRIGLIISIVFSVVVILLTAFLFLLIPDNFKRESISTWDCEKPTVEFDSDMCTGVDLAQMSGREKDIFNFSSPSVKSAQKIMSLYMVAKRKSADVGLDIQVGVEFNVTFKQTNKKETYDNTIIIRCPVDNDICDAVEIYSGQVNDYFVNFRFKSSDENVKDFLPDAIGEVTMRWVYGNPRAAISELVVRYIFNFVTIVLLIWYLLNFARNPFLKTVEQRWLIPFIGFLIIYDNPLFALQIYYSDYILASLDNFFTALFFSFSMFYTLVILGGFITRKTTVIFFVVPRFILALAFLVFFSFFLITSLSVPFIQEALDSNPFYRTGFAAVSLVFFLIWALWFLYTVVRVVVISKQHPKAIKGRYRFFAIYIIVMIVLFLSVIFASPFVPSERYRDWLGLWGHTIADVFGWIMMVWLSSTRLPRVTSTTLHGAMRPKKKAGESDEDKEVEMDDKV